MVKVCGAVVGSCLIFFINLNICNPFNIEPIQIRNKRQATNLTTEYKNIPEPNVNTSSTVDHFLISSNENHNTTSDVKQEPPDTNQNIENLNISTTVTPLLHEKSTDKPILDVNGAGRHKDYITTPLPAISETINTSSKASKSSVPKKVFSDPKIAAEEELIDTIDVGENNTKKSLFEHNITKINEDYHVYYNSSMIVDPKLTNNFWESFKNISSNSLLSTSHRRAMTVRLSFDFPFYGHLVRNVTVATGGFLYTGEYVHSWLAATQYIAPLMANFDTSLSNDSFVKFADNGTAFTVIWENVVLQDKPDVGTFTFSTTLHESGDIVFAYFSVPVLIKTIENDEHPVKIGLSDAYIVDQVILFARRKTIFEYHRVNFGNQDITNSTIIYLSAEPTCLKYTDCMSCLHHDTKFSCSWCPALNKCSTGTDRKRQDWIQKGCDRTQLTNVSFCPPIGQKGNNAAEENHSIPSRGDVAYRQESLQEHNFQEKTVIPTYEKSSSESINKEEKSNVGLVLGLMLPICLVMSALGWILYAYRNPHTKSGQLLIQYRPSQWTWRRGEARYTAATIHM